MDAILGIEVERLSRFHVEGGVPGIDVSDRGRAVAAWGVAVDDHLLPQRLIPGLHPPALTETDEELLVGGQTGDDGPGLPAQRKPVGVVGGGQSGNVCDVLPESLFPV